MSKVIYTDTEKREMRKEIVDRLNKPNYFEREQMKKYNLTWELFFSQNVHTFL
jgi:hypothetical protein